MSSPTRLYLGLDSSTQQLKAIVIDENLQTIAEEAVCFNDQSNLQHHVQPNGFVVDRDDPRCITTPVFVFLEALDVLLKKLREQKKFNLADIVAISGCGQQHGSVYWKTKAGLDQVKNFHSSENQLAQGLVDLLAKSFSRIECPIWMDSSTTEQCQTLEKAVGGAEHLFQITGSKAYERFTGSQIMKVAQKTPEIYEETECIQLISNFMASVLMGDYAPIDLSDGSGMNLLDIRQHRWSTECLNACGKDLETKLSSTLVYPRTAVGTIADYFVQRHGFNNQCHIVSFTGDNPSSYYALASDPKTVVISLGTSDTVMASIPAAEMPKQAIEGHLLVNPLTANPESHLLMLLLCFKNGSLVRERVREEASSNDWKAVSDLLAKTAPSNDGYLGFFYDDYEILPQNVQGRFYFDGNNQRVDQLEPAVKVRAVLEGQFLAKRLYLQRVNVDLNKHVDRIVVTGTKNRTDLLSKETFDANHSLTSGGASVNIDLLQILADIFGKPVYTALAPNSGALGGALRAVDVVNEKPNHTTSTVECRVVAQPRQEYTSIYEQMLIRYAQCEENILGKSQ